jgi:phosphatidylglycerophosphatase C
VSRSLPVVDSERVRERIDRLLDVQPEGALVFDADGTLWRHDVGCQVFEAAAARGAFRDSAQDRLYAEATRLGGSPGIRQPVRELIRLIETALAGHAAPERALAEFQVWAYLDFSEQDLRAFCREVLDGPEHRAGLHHEVLDLAAHARGRGARTCVVSASPRIVVEEALSGLGFELDQIVAGDPRWTEGRIDVGLELPLPYGPDKAVAGRRLLGETVWLATFGDSGFDLDMMQEARFAVGVGGKPQLLAGLAEHPDAVLLAL